MPCTMNWACHCHWPRAQANPPAGLLQRSKWYELLPAPRAELFSAGTTQQTIRLETIDTQTSLPFSLSRDARLKPIWCISPTKVCICLVSCYEITYGHVALPFARFALSYTHFVLWNDRFVLSIEQFAHKLTVTTACHLNENLLPTCGDVLFIRTFCIVIRPFALVNNHFAPPNGRFAFIFMIAPVTCFQIM